MLKRRPSPSQRPSGSVLVSALVHVVVLTIFATAIEWRVPISDFFRPSSPSETRRERVTFVTPDQTVRADQPVASPGRDGGDDLPEREGAVSAPLVAPTEVPGVIPPPGITGGEEAGGTGERIGRGGATAGLRPIYTDPRLWVTPGQAPPSTPLTEAQMLDSVLASDVATEIAGRPAPGREPGDWTFERNGQKYGVDRKFIHLGKFSIPTALLGLLPINQQANPIALERESRLASMRVEINEQAQRAVTEEDFRAAVRNISERKERERSAEQARQRTAVSAPQGGSR